jgi:hypothetical protein
MDYQQLQTIREKYPILGPTLLSKEMGLSYSEVYCQARRMGIKVNKTHRYSRYSQTVTQRYDILDLSIWTPDLTPIGAYYLGIFWADATVDYKTPEQARNGRSRYFLQISLTVDEWSIIYKLAEVLRLSPDRVRPVKKYQEHHKDPKVLKLSGKRIASLMIDHYGILPRKSYINPAHPHNIPDDLYWAWALGIFDGDGSSNLSSVTPQYSWYTSPLFMEEFHPRLKANTRLQLNPPTDEQGTLKKLQVCDPHNVWHLAKFLYQGYEKDPQFPLAHRKHRRFLDYLQIYPDGPPPINEWVLRNSRTVKEDRVY